MAVPLSTSSSSKRLALGIMVIVVTCPLLPASTAPLHRRRRAVTHITCDAHACLARLEVENVDPVVFSARRWSLKARDR
jgi:hypothetical protein